MIRNKIKGNVGEVEGTQFIHFAENIRQTVDIEKLLDGKCSYPSDPNEMSLTVTRIVQYAQADNEEAAKAGSQARRRLERAIMGLVRLPRHEYALMGLKQLLAINEETVKTAFSEMDNAELRAFVKQHYAALGITPGGGLSDRAKKGWLKLWG